MIQTNTTAQLNCSREEILSILNAFSIEVVNGYVWNANRRKFSPVRGKPFVFINKQNNRMVEIIYFGHKIEVLWYKVLPIGGETR